ncbi:hypothetical protein MNB_SV-15-429 [hydrothermal vent metagenome]|uniref:Uncharacterized protein n=1 Tax=hydrothermal vent metagenome TaxID=652676 RepID=A0A1W1EIW1_9ZZZZ
MASENLTYEDKGEEEVIPTSQAIDYLNLISGQLNSTLDHIVPQIDSIATSIGGVSMAVAMAIANPTSTKADDFAVAYNGKEKVYTIKYNGDYNPPYEKFAEICDRNGNGDMDTEVEGDCAEYWLNRYDKQHSAMEEKVIEDLDKKSIALDEVLAGLQKEGKRLDEEGKRLDEEGKRLDEEGKRLDEDIKGLKKEGKRLDEDGKMLDKTNARFSKYVK